MIGKLIVVLGCVVAAMSIVPWLRGEWLIWGALIGGAAVIQFVGVVVSER